MGLRYRRVIVSGHPVGLQGIDEIFDALYTEGYRSADADLGEEIVRLAKQHNYIPSSAMQAYAKTLLHEYQVYVTLRDSGGTLKHIDYGTWHGYPREQIPWFPTVNAELCNGCGVCLKLCSSHALVATADNKVSVGDPFKCVVGCSSCATICRPKAISFPPRSMLKAYPLRGK